MADRAVRFANNLKELRKLYNESQAELAVVIGVSTGTIGKYESPKNNKTNPNRDVIKKIAMHYRITEEELMYADFNIAGSISEKLTFKDLYKINFSMFPIVKSDEALINDYFRQGYEAQIRVQEALENGKVFDNEDVDICFDAYSKVDLPESDANYLWWLILMEITASNTDMISAHDYAAYNKDIQLDEYIKNVYLNNLGFEKYQLFEKDDISEDELKQEIEKTLIKIKSNSKYGELAYYYTAVRYCCNCIKNDKSDELNKLIGLEMLYSFANLGNKYALNTIKMLLNSI